MIKVNKDNADEIYVALKDFYRNEIIRISEEVGSRELSRQLNSAESIISATIRRDSFSNMRKLYKSMLDVLNQS